LGAALVIAAACTDVPEETPALFTTVEALAIDVAGLPPQAEAFVLDIGTSRLYRVGPNAAHLGSVAVPTPPGGWIGGAVVALRSDVTAVTISQAAPGGSLLRLDLDPFAGARSDWTSTAAERLIDWDGRPAPQAGTVVTTANGERLLPPDLAALPGAVGDAGFAYAATDGSIAWWDPVSAVTRWRLAADAAGPFDSGSGVAAWVEAGRVLTAPVSAAGAGATAWAPLEAAPLDLRIAAGSPVVVWLSTADGALQRLGLGDEPGILCYADRDTVGTAVSDTLFRDTHALSNPSLELTRLGRENCPGWARNDAWVVTWQEQPAPWSGITLAPAGSISDVTQGEWAAAGDLFVTADATHEIVSVEPLVLQPPLAAPTEGDLKVVGRWTLRNARDGFVATIAPDALLDLPALALQIRSGADVADGGDRFTFRLTNGTTPFAVAGVVDGWQVLAGGQVLAVDRKGLAVHAFAPATQVLAGTLR
jgi:hypothetical protein